MILEHRERPTVVLPVHRGDIPKGLLLHILKDAGFTLEDFQKS